jgi:hypothetical protein
MNKLVEELIEQRLYELMEEFSYEELDPENKAFVDEYSSKDAYSDQYEMIKELLIVEADEDLEIGEPILKQRSFFEKVITFRIPTYAVAASIALAVTITVLFNNSDKSQTITIADVEQPNQIEEFVIDTLQKTQTIVNPELAKLDSMHSIQLEESIKNTLSQKPSATNRNDKYDEFFTSI